MKIVLTTLTPENRKLICDEDEVYFVNPDEVMIKFDGSYPLIHRGREIYFDLIPARNTTKVSYSCLFKVAAYLNKTYDPITRFGGPPKFNREFYTSQLGYNIPSYFFFSIQGVLDNYKYINFPVITKSQDGTYGQGIGIVNSFNELRKYIIEFDFKNRVLFLQQLLTNYREYRVTTFNDSIVSIVRKHKTDLTEIDKYDNDCLYTDIHLIMEKLSYLSLEGLYGIDIAIKNMSDFYIFEQNRSPEFAYLPKQEVDSIVKIIRRYYDKSSV